MKRNGVAVIYMIVVMTAMVAFASLGADYARVQLAKTELRTAVDAAARHGAGGLAQGPVAVQARVLAAAASNKVDGQPLAIDPIADIEFGIWNPADKSFTIVTGEDRLAATAIRVTARRTAARGNGVPTPFAGILGQRSCDVKASVIAARGRITSTDTEADSCPWLVGMPNGSVVAAYDGNTRPAVAPAQNAPQVQGLPIIPGSTISFRQATGQTTYTAGGPGSGQLFSPDGNTSWIVQQRPVNGINSTKAPLNCLVGIFLDDRRPDATAMASVADFTTEASRDFTTLSPQLKQVFFIGDGVNSRGELQNFVVPPNATRFFLAIMDEKGWWWDNVGTINITTIDTKVTIVK